jgi:drug/metabolite transporter (DMT)-like permease
MPEFIGPLALVFLRVCGAALLFWILSLFVKTQKIEKKDLIKMLWLAAFGIVINQCFFIYGLSLTHPINSAIIMISNPIIVFIFAVIVLKEKVTILKFSGLTIAMIGAAVLLLFRGNLSGGKLQFGSETLMGDVMTLINSISWAVFIVMAKPMLVKYDTVSAMRWIFLFGSIYMLPIGGSDILQTNWAHFTPHAVFATTFVVVATTFLAYLLNVYGLRGLSPEATSAYIYLQPFLASSFAIYLGKDELTATKILSGILIILGLYLVSFKPRMK